MSPNLLILLNGNDNAHFRKLLQRLNETVFGITTQLKNKIQAVLWIGTVMWDHQDHRVN